MFRLVDHTADLAIEATGRTRDEALAEAALGLASVLTGRTDPRHSGAPDREIRFVLEAPDADALVVAVLSELLWLHESEDLLWLGGGIQVEEVGDMVRATATGNGLRHDPAVQGRGVEVKAVTYHDLQFARDGDHWRVWVLLDI